MATERECDAVVWAILTIRLNPAGFHFVVQTDHNALQWMMTLRDLTERLMRWILRLLEFYYDVFYRPGRVNQEPDALSHLDRGEDDESDFDDELATFLVGKKSKVEDNLHVVQAIIRRQILQ